jgi:hypothetical protein
MFRRFLPVTTATWRNVSHPIVAGNRVEVPNGTRFTNAILATQSAERLREHSRMKAAPKSFGIHGVACHVSTAPDSQATGSRNKLDLPPMDGAPLAEKGTGAAVSLGAAAGIGTACIAGRRNATLPVVTIMAFELRSKVAVSRS